MQELITLCVVVQFREECERRGEISYHVPRSFKALLMYSSLAEQCKQLRTQSMHYTVGSVVGATIVTCLAPFVTLVHLFLMSFTTDHLVASA